MLTDADVERLASLRTIAIGAARLWLALASACDKGEADRVKEGWRQVRDASVKAVDIIHGLDGEKPNA